MFVKLLLLLFNEMNPFLASLWVCPRALGWLARLRDIIMYLWHWPHCLFSKSWVVWGDTKRALCVVTAPIGNLREGQDGCLVPKSLKGSGGAVRTQERIRWARSKGIEARHVTWKALYSSFLFLFFFLGWSNQWTWSLWASQTCIEKRKKKPNLTGMWGEGSKLNITVACSLVADKNQVVFSEKHV